MSSSWTDHTALVNIREKETECGGGGCKLSLAVYRCAHGAQLTLSLTGVGPFGPSLLYVKIPQNVLKVRYRKKIDIPQAGSWACFEITRAPIMDLISL
jgi:hypothetical protein